MNALVVTSLILAVTMVLFIWNKWPAAIVAIASALALFFTGILNVRETVEGFGDPLVVFIGALLAIGVALESTGVGTWAGQLLIRQAGTNKTRLILALMLVSALFTAVIGMNGAVVTVLPIAVAIAARTGVAPSKFMMPVSIACLTSSSLTLLGTPVNVIALDYGEAARAGGVGFFEWSFIGIPMFAGALVIVLVFERWLLPNRTSSALTAEPAAQDVSLTGESFRAIAILLVLIVLLTLNVMPTAIAALLCAAAMVVFRVVNLNQLYQKIDWNTCILVAALIPLATAMTKTGLAGLIGDQVIHLVGAAGPRAVLAGVFVVTAALTQVISNASSALVMVPIAVATAGELSISPWPLLIAVVLGAGAAHLTPVSTPVNLVTYGPGGYEFRDYWKMGLLIVVWAFLVAVFIAPLHWKF